MLTTYARIRRLREAKDLLQYRPDNHAVVRDTILVIISELMEELQEQLETEIAADQ